MYVSRRKHRLPAGSAAEEIRPAEERGSASERTPEERAPEERTPEERAPEERTPEPERESAEEAREETEESAPQESGAPSESPVELIDGREADGPEVLGREPGDDARLSYEEFMEKNPRTGALKVQAFLGMRSLPVAEASVTVEKTLSDGLHVFASAVTDPDGSTRDLPLPAPERENSQLPGSDNPFAVYRVRVSHPGYLTAVFSDVPIFAGVKSIQQVSLLPDPGAEA